MAVYRKKNIPWRIIDEQAVVVNPKKSLVYPLNTTSARIWQLVDGIKDTGEIIEIISNEFDVDEKTIKSDALNFISQLKEEGLIEEI